MKKLVSLLLALLLALIECAFAAAAHGVSDCPVILVAGYSSTSMEAVSEDGSVQKVWGLDFDEVGRIAMEKLPQLLVGAGKMTEGDFEYLGSLVGTELSRLCEPLKCGEDGKSIYNVRPILESTAEQCRWSTMPEEYKSETEIFAEVEKYVSPDRIFNFGCDFRMGAVENAHRLNEFILDVLDDTGSDKVNIFAVSHGGQITGTYLSIYGCEGKVNNCVMAMPAMGGAALAYDVISGNVEFDENTLMNFIEHGFKWKEDYHILTQAQRLGFLDDLIEALLPYVYEVIFYWGSIWDFIPLDYFDEAVKLLDSEKSAPLIEKTTYFHENIAANYGENLKKALDSGVNITIISGYGMPSVTGLKEQSDAIIRTADTSGAVCAPYSMRFSDGYRTLNTSCGDESHNHLSPSMEIDASAAWLPENTWFVDGLYHGMEYHDEYTRRLMFRQLLSDNPLTSVHDDAQFPQFRDSSNACYPVSVRFDKSSFGYLSGEDTSIIITNNLSDASVDVYSLKAYGAQLDFEPFYCKTIKPGESVCVSFTARLEEVSLKRCAVTVSYAVVPSITPVGSMQFAFTLMNGEKLEYDSSQPYSPSDFDDACESAPDFVKASPFASLISAFMRIAQKLLAYVKSIIAIFI